MAFSMASLMARIWLDSCEFSFVVTDAAMTGRETPHARPSAVLLGRKMYGTFCMARVSHVSGRRRRRTLSSHSSGRCSRISSGSVSAVSTMNSEMPRFSVLVAADNTSESSVRWSWRGVRTFVRALLELLIVGRLLDEVQNLHTR